MYFMWMFVVELVWVDVLMINLIVLYAETV